MGGGGEAGAQQYSELSRSVGTGQEVGGLTEWASRGSEWAEENIESSEERV